MVDNGKGDTFESVENNFSLKRLKSPLFDISNAF
jgi:hypothetical protein